MDYAAQLRGSRRMNGINGAAQAAHASDDCARRVSRTCALWRSMLATPLSLMNLRPVALRPLLSKGVPLQMSV